MHTSRLSDAADLELGALVTPSGRILLAGVLPRDVFSELSGDTRIWMRWAGPEDTGREGPRIEFAAATPRDEAVRTARVIAGAPLANPRIAWSVYKLLEIQGLSDLLLVGPNSCSELIHELVCADLTRRSTQYGLSVNHFPERYV